MGGNQPVGGVTGKGHTSSVKTVQKKQQQTNTKNIQMVQNKKEEVTQDPTTGTYAAEKINDIEIKLQEQKLKAMKASPEDKKKIDEEIKNLKQKKKNQDETAVLKETKDGNIQFKLKKDIKANDLSKLFDIKQGSLKNNSELDLDYVWREYPEGSAEREEGRQYKDWNTTIPKGKVFTISPAEVAYRGFWSELFQ